MWPASTSWPSWCRPDRAGLRAAGNTGRVDELSYAESIDIARDPEALYDMVSDVTRMGEWSPVCTGGSWDER